MMNLNYVFFAPTQQVVPELEVGEFNEPILDSWIGYLKGGGDPHREVPPNGPLILAAFEGLICHLFDDQLNLFLELMDLLLIKGADPNLKFTRITIHNDVFLEINFLVALYAFWKLGTWPEEKEQVLESLFDRLLADLRVDLRAAFSEEYSNREVPRDNFCEFDNSTGDLLEQANILHYASLFNDTLSINKLLLRDPDLIRSFCHVVSGKNMLTSLYADPQAITQRVLDKNSPGILAFVGSRRKESIVFNVERKVRVTCLHIAAKTLGSSLPNFLIGSGAYRGAVDSSNQSPLKYLENELDYLEGKKILKLRGLKKLLKYVPTLPLQLPQAHLLIHKDGFSILYDTRTKVAIYVYERLTKDKLPLLGEERPGYFRQDQHIPLLNRAKTTDYTYTDYDRGHMRAAGNATGLSKKETFIMSNVFPQNHNLNITYWKMLENRVRILTQSYRVVEVFTGVLYCPTQCQDGKKRVIYEVIGKGEIAVPTHSYKVLFIHQENKIYPQAYMFPNSQIEARKTIEDFMVPVELIQQLSGILFNSHN